jgi:hypothetical protein
MLGTSRWPKVLPGKDLSVISNSENRYNLLLAQQFRQAALEFATLDLSHGLVLTQTVASERSKGLLEPAVSERQNQFR